MNLLTSNNPDRISTVRIRSITCFINPSYPLESKALALARNFITQARSAFIDDGFEVQSTRLATVPFPLLFEAKLSELAPLAQEIESEVTGNGYDYLSLGPAHPENLTSYSLIPDALANTSRTFFSGMMTTPGREISLSAVRQCAEVIHHSSRITADGFSNLRFAALANVEAGSPFFPAAYHHGGEPAFALATEAADLALKAVSQAQSLQEAGSNLVGLMESHARALRRIAHQVEQATGVNFIGIDFSLAPFPSEALSLGAAVEQLGVRELGASGSLAAIAFLAGTIDRANFTRTGFNGLFFPVLEDAVLALRAAEGNLNVTDLLLYSAVCGTGLDTVPLPGDTSPGQLYAILLDLASLSSRLAKPLTARLMPIPGKKAGDPTGFDFEFFANSRVLPIHAYPLEGLLGGSETFGLHSRLAE